jgi:2-polyprenyl-3-methyl-5-hydroxy-6-metoxy-1,4-benzoquinol methylase
MTIKQKVLRRINRHLGGRGWELARTRALEAAPGYRENPEVGSKNFSEKMARLERGEPFEWPNMLSLNQAAARFIGPARQIVNIGAGTGAFEWFVSVDPSLDLVASEFDPDCVRWCRENRQRENIRYCSADMAVLRDEYGGFDLAVAVDVIEHVGDFGAFLGEFSHLADRAIITTPNRARTSANPVAGPPAYYQHVREWTAGEFYWVLRAFYSRVELHAMPDVHVPATQEVGLDTELTPLIAVCER